jgi:glutamyl/glutaminyl-tRNA synthetase
MTPTPTRRRRSTSSRSIEDISWLGYEPPQPVHASDYFDQLYDWAELPDPGR